MIRNILFDMGSVLVRFEPAEFIAKLSLGPEDAEALRREVFRSADWVRLDRGVFTQRQMIDAACGRLPARLHPYVEDLVLHWDADRPEVPGMYELVRELSERGYATGNTGRASASPPSSGSGSCSPRSGSS